MLLDHLNRRRLEREAAALTRTRRIADSPCAPRQHVRNEAAGPIDGGDDGIAQRRELLAFCSNDYLGLANDARIVEAFAEGARRFGAGSGASHLISGHSAAHEALESDFAAFLSPCIPAARALTFGSGYLANLALMTTLTADASATIFGDKLNHASLVDGTLLARVPFRRYAHARLDVLETQLAACETPLKLIATDAVFSMDGDLADLPALLALAERFDAWIVLDDAHGFGMLGHSGRGTLSHFGLRSERFIWLGTLGKAAGVGGAVVCAHPAVIDALVQGGRSYIYTTASPPALAHALRESLRIISSDEGERRRVALAAHVETLRAGLSRIVDAHSALGWRLADSRTAIQPLIVGSNSAALALAAALESDGLLVPAVRPPSVPEGSARLRITLSAVHSAADVQQLLSAIARVADALAMAG